ncbi:MAG TPA: hypothetical protein VGX92_00230, partial [Pyrinomonadaceae bacterium]|nr:hypothetical protein [Pyrinomonadaceae bacterium]
MTITCGLKWQALRSVLFSIVVLFILAGSSEAYAATLTVPSGGDFQAALNAAAPGDTIILEASASFIGPFTLPAKASTSSSFITIQSSALASLPASRVSPQHASLMPKLLSPGNNLPALLTAPSAHH